MTLLDYKMKPVHEGDEIIVSQPHKGILETDHGDGTATIKYQSYKERVAWEANMIIYLRTPPKEEE